MRETLEEKIANATTLLDVLLILKEMIAIDTHVATLAYVEDVIEEYDSDRGYGILSCKPFPLAEGQSEYILQTYWLDEDAEFKKGQKVLVIFCDRNFIASLQALNGSVKESQDTKLHDMKYGVVLCSSRKKDNSD